MPVTRRTSDRQAAARTEPYPTIKPGDKPKALAEKTTAAVNKTVPAPKATTVKKPILSKPEMMREPAKKAPAKKAAPKEVTKKVSTDKVTKTKAGKGKAAEVKEKETEPSVEKDDDSAAADALAIAKENHIRKQLAEHKIAMAQGRAYCFEPYNTEKDQEAAESAAPPKQIGGLKRVKATKEVRRDPAVVAAEKSFAHILESLSDDPKDSIKKGRKTTSKGGAKKANPVVEEGTLAEGAEAGAAEAKESMGKKVKAKAKSSAADDSPADVDMSSTQEDSKKASEKSGKGKAAEDKPKSYLDIELEGDNTSIEIPIYDTCSEVRRKINSLLLKDSNKPENGIPGEFKKDGTPKPFTKALFSELLGVSPRMVTTFLNAKKMMGGAESEVYTAAYKFFEKKRIWEGKKKTAGRLKVEEDMPNGLPLRDPNKMRIWVRKGENPRDFLNKYGN